MKQHCWHCGHLKDCEKRGKTPDGTNIYICVSCTIAISERRENVGAPEDIAKLKRG